MGSLRDIFWHAVRDRLRRFWDDADGAVAVIAAVTLPIIIGIAALSLEYGMGLLTRVEQQRIADLSSYTAASIYSSTMGDDADKAAAATLAGKNIAALNGINPDDVVVEFLQYDGSPIARATINTERTLMLARVLSSSQLRIEASASTVMESDPGYACVIGLETGEIDDAVLLNGNVTVELGHCSFAANNQFSINGNPTIDAHCTSPASDDTDADQNCIDGWNRGGPFDDPYLEELAWNTTCEGKKKTVLGDDQELEPDTTYCISDVDQSGKWTVTGDRVKLLFDPRMLPVVKIAGNQTLSLQNSIIYAPGSTLDLRGTVSLTGLDCNGVVSKRIILRGTVYLKGECKAAKDLGLDGTPRSSIRLVL